MAHVNEIHRASGKTVYEVKWRDNGKFRQQTFSIKREAERHAASDEKVLAEGQSTAPLVKNTKTFQQVAEAMLAASKGRLKPRSYDGLVLMYARHVFPAFGSKRIGAISSADIEAWIAKLSRTPTKRTKQPLHPSTIKHAFVSLNKVFRYAIKHRYIAHNPATGTDLPKVQHSQRFEPTFLAPREIEALASALDAHEPDGLFVRVAAYTGLRAGELIALQIRDVNIMRRQIEVRRTIVRTKDGLKEDSPKSQMSIRSVPLRRELALSLADYLAEHPHASDPTASLWPGRNYGGYGDWRGALDWDKRMDYDSFYRNRFRPAANELGLTHLRFHDLRHTAASLFAASGMPLARVARVLGHADTATTYKVYLHFFPDDFSADMDRLDAYLAPSTEQKTTSRLDYPKQFRAGA